jgi:hypothetical protein
MFFDAYTECKVYAGCTLYGVTAHIGCNEISRRMRAFYKIKLTPRGHDKTAICRSKCYVAYGASMTADGTFDFCS